MTFLFNVLLITYKIVGQLRRTKLSAGIPCQDYIA